MRAGIRGVLFGMLMVLDGFVHRETMRTGMRGVIVSILVMLFTLSLDCC